MTATSADQVDPDAPAGVDEEPRRRRLRLWLPLVLLLLIGALVGAVMIGPGGGPQRFHGADGITIRDRGREPMWWADLVVVAPSTTATTLAPPPPSTSVPNPASTPDTTLPATTVAPPVKVIAPGDALFGSGSSELLPDSRSALEDTLRGIVKTGVVTHVAVRCYTDDRGSAEYNERLSDDRAEAITDVLVSVGVDRGLIDAEGLGISHANDNGTETGRALNRRCEIEITVQP